MRLSYRKAANAGLEMALGSVALALDAPRRPRQTLYRFQGWAYRYLLDRFHHDRVSEYQGHLLPLHQALTMLTGQGEQDILGLSYDGLDRWKSTGPSQDDGGKSPIPPNYGATLELMKVVYAICRLMRPSAVVETGVARGMTTTAILAALEENGAGHLHSVELPGLSGGYAHHVGEAVPHRLRGRWSLVFGPTRMVLPRLLRELGTIQLFLQDSAHSYHPQKKDYEVALDHMAPGGILVSDGVRTDAFIEVAEARAWRWCTVGQPKPFPIGILSVPGPGY